MATLSAVAALGIRRRSLPWLVTGPPRHFWSRSRKEKEPVVDEVIEEVKKDPVPVCPPLRSRTYTPPDDLQGRLESRVKEVFGPSVPPNWQDISLEDGHLKFRLLAHLADDLGHAVPNSKLHQLCTVRDVLEFYTIPAQDIAKFDELTARNLPPNLKITWGY
ncbi:large ribosomal subunit protein mL50 [Tenrec ecaudatus]|uniref:large ribosomal subunit protein mL50 n=1 Tax=Tenrec ecaudatus TaxID=94439 RepID=UPI003F591AF5